MLPQERLGRSKLRGAPRCAQERPGTPRSAQESRTKSRTKFPPRENEKSFQESFQESLERLFGPVFGSCVGAYYAAKLNVFGISSGRSENFVWTFVGAFKKIRLTFRREVRQIRRAPSKISSGFRLEFRREHHRISSGAS